MKKKELVTIQALEGSYILPPKDVEKCVKIFLQIEEFEKHFTNQILIGIPTEKALKNHLKAYYRHIIALKKLLPNAI